jgi:hypothetical protein
MRQKNAVFMARLSQLYQGLGLRMALWGLERMTWVRQAYLFTANLILLVIKYHVLCLSQLVQGQQRLLRQWLIN